MLGSNSREREREMRKNLNKYTYCMNACMVSYVEWSNASVSFLQVLYHTCVLLPSKHVFQLFIT